MNALIDVLGPHTQISPTEAFANSQNSSDLVSLVQSLVPDRSLRPREFGRTLYLGVVGKALEFAQNGDIACAEMLLDWRPSEETNIDVFGESQEGLPILKASRYYESELGADMWHQYREFKAITADVAHHYLTSRTYELVKHHILGIAAGRKLKLSIGLDQQTSEALQEMQVIPDYKQGDEIIKNFFKVGQIRQLSRRILPKEEGD